MLHSSVVGVVATAAPLFIVLIDTPVIIRLRPVILSVPVGTWKLVAIRSVAAATGAII
jgi:hypothetical protein